MISLIIPAFNEEQRIGKSLEQIFRFCNAQALPFEVIVVDDGSSDDTVALIRRRFGDEKQLESSNSPCAEAKAQRCSKACFRGAETIVFFSDADLSVPIAMLSTFLAELRNNCDIAIGSRRAPGAIIEIHQPFFRELMGRVFTSLSNLVLGLRHSDATCGFKGFRREIATDLFARQRLAQLEFRFGNPLISPVLKDIESHEIPVTWRNDKALKCDCGKT